MPWLAALTPAAGALPGEPSDKLGRALLHAVRANSSEVGSGREPQVAAQVAALLSAGADPDIADAQGTAVAHAAGLGQVRVIESLLDAGADPDARVAGRSAVHAAVAARQAEALRALAIGGADLALPNEAGLLPLHAAALSGDVALVELLLSLGADRWATDAQGRTAAGLALAHGHDAVLAALQREPWDAPPAPVPTQTSTYDGGLDLAQLGAATSTKDHQQLDLKPGRYTGTLVIRGERTVVLRGDPAGGTVFAGGPGSAVVAVLDGARLVLEGVTLEPAERSQVGVFVRGGSVWLRGCAVRGAPLAGCRIEGGTLVVERCSLGPMPGVGIAALGASQVAVRDTTFADCGRLGVGLEGEATLEARWCRFERTGAHAVSVEGGASAVLAWSTVGPSEHAAVRVAAGSGLAVHDCMFDVPGQAVRVTDSTGDVTIRRTRITATGERADATTGDDATATIDLDTTGRILITENVINHHQEAMRLTGEVTHPAIVARNAMVNVIGGAISDMRRAPPADTADAATAARFIRNRIVNPERHGVIVRWGRAVLVGNDIVCRTAKPLTLQDGGSATLNGNVLITADVALNFAATDAKQTLARRELIIGSIGHDSKRGPNLAPATERLLRDVTFHPGALHLDDTARRVLDAADRLRRDAGVADTLRGAWRSLMGQANWTRARATRMAPVSLHVTDALGQTREPAVTVYDGLVPVRGSAALRTEDLKDAAELARRLVYPEAPFMQELASTLPSEVRVALEQHASERELPPRVALALARALNDVIDEAALYRSPSIAQIPLTAVAREQVRLARETDAAAQPDATQLASRRRANRLLLEEACRGLVATGREVAVHAGEGPLHLPPGTYWLEATAAPDLSRAVRVTDTTPVSVTVEASPRVWLSTQRGATTEAGSALLVRLKPVAARREVLSSLRWPVVDEFWDALPRPGATVEGRNEALTLARRTLDERPGDAWLGPRTTASERWQQQAALRWVGRIFSVAGAATDADRLAQVATAAGAAVALRRAQVIGIIDARLGRLDKGTLVAGLTGDDVDWAAACAIALDDLGVSRGRDVLERYLHEPGDPWLAERVAFALLDTPDGAALPVMRRVVDQYLQRGANDDAPPNPYHDAAGVASAYLLAWGDAEDQRCGAAVPLKPAHLLLAGLLADDPRPVAAELARVDWALLAELTPVAEAFDAGTAEAYRQAFRTLVFEAARRDPMRYFITEGDVAAGDLAMQAVDLYDAHRAFHEPNRGVAGHHLHSHTRRLAPRPWVPLTWQADQYAQQVTGNSVTAEVQLDWLPPEQVRELIGATQAGSANPWTPLYLACHRVTMRAGVNDMHLLPRGEQRRAVVLREPGKAALSLAVSVKPVVETDSAPPRLAFAVAVRTAGHFIDGSGEQVARFERYLSQQTAALITAVRLRRGDEPVATEVAPTPDGGLYVTCDLPPAALHGGDGGLYLELDVTMLNQQTTLVYDLFASDAARRARAAHQ